MSDFKLESDLAAAKLKKHLNYDAETGVFKRKIALSNSINAGDVAGSEHTTHGYVFISILGVKYRAHNLAWLYVHGEWPDGEIDHINHNRADNRIDNLRVVTRTENSRNMPQRSDNTSGTCGVCWHKKSGKWMASIKINGKHKYLGVFSEIVNAISARKAAEEKYGFHMNHGVENV